MIQIVKYKQGDRAWYDYTVKRLDRIIKIRKILSYDPNY
jgi:hypothetical protein